jgi:putative membrane protein
MKWLLKIFFTWIAVIVASWLLPGVEVKNQFTALLVAIVWSILDLFVKPLLILLTLPITIFTLGIFLIFINAIIVLIDDAFIHGFSVDGIWWALLFSFVVSIIVTILQRFDKSSTTGKE